MHIKIMSGNFVKVPVIIVHKLISILIGSVNRRNSPEPEFFYQSFLRPVLVQSRCNDRELTKEHAASVTQEAGDYLGVQSTPQVCQSCSARLAKAVH